MFEGVKNKIAEFILARKIKKRQSETRPFNNFISDARTVLICAPETGEDGHLFELANHLQNLGKDVKLLIKEAQKSSFEGNESFTKIFFNDEDKTWLNLPTKDFLFGKLNREIDIFIDLNMKPNIFISGVAALVSAKFKVGFVKENSDKYYNFQVPSQINTEISYRNLLNSFRMF